MKWTKAKPTEPGWYLERSPDRLSEDWNLIRLERLHPEPEELTVCYEARAGHEWVPEPFEYVPEWGLEWAGPIQVDG